MQERLPFVCPLDHVVEPSYFDDGISEVKIAYKESSFLDNPRVLMQLNASTGGMVTAGLVAVTRVGSLEHAWHF